MKLNTNLNDVLILQDNLIVNSKIIGAPGIEYIQIIDPEGWKQGGNFSLNNILLLITI